MLRGLEHDIFLFHFFNFCTVARDEGDLTGGYGRLAGGDRKFWRIGGQGLQNAGALAMLSGVPFFGKIAPL
jgi:hypothetical protein